ncbi:MAG TPA: 4'-phosphopantetheinyl transferase superfamily protein [Pseudolabrys sp.]|nr:4'-phosphopantetheinyl transferase superfamily protein [Pseudolabrys sp.]
MTTARNQPLAEALQSLARPDLLIGCRIIAPGDEFALSPEEAASISARGFAARRASGAARIVARELLSRLGLPASGLPKGPSGAPQWPRGVVGSFAHDNTVAVAAIGRREAYAGIGIDLEPAEALPADTLALVATAAEQRRLADDPLRGKLLFVVKEAVYKAVHPLDGEFLEFHDIEVDFTAGTASLRNGRVIHFSYVIAARLVALTVLPVRNQG